MGLAELCYVTLIKHKKIKELSNKIVKRKTKERFCRQCRSNGIFYISNDLEECSICFKNYCEECIKSHNFNENSDINFSKSSIKIPQEKRTIQGEQSLVEKYNIPFVFNQMDQLSMRYVHKDRIPFSRAWIIYMNNFEKENEQCVRINIALS